MTAEELQQLLKVAQLCPLAEYGRETVKLPSEECKGRGTWIKAPLTLNTIDAAAARAREVLAGRPEFVEELERTGRERALIYKTMVLTGLRVGELSSLRVGQVDLDGRVPFVTQAAEDEKAGRGAEIPIRDDLAADLRAWLAKRL